MENVNPFNENMYIWPTSTSIHTLKYSLSILITLLLALHLWVHLFLALSISAVAFGHST